MSQSLLHEVFNGEELSELSMDVAETFDCIATPRPKQVANTNPNPFLDASKEDCLNVPEPQGTTSTANTEQTLVQASTSVVQDDLDYDDDEVNELTILTAKLDDLSSMDEDDEMSQTSTATTMSAFAPVHNLQTTSISSSSCVISLVKHISTSSLHVVKTFTKASISYDTPTLEYAMTEQMMLRLLTQMQVPFVLRLRWSFQDEETLRLVTDYCSGGDLQSYVEQAGPLHPSQAWLYAAELADTLCTLHSSGITHRAICPEHILIGSDGHIVLTGFSRACITSFTSPRSVSSTSTKAGRGAPTTFNGRPRYSIWTAPEVILGWKSDHSADWWGFGCILGFMLGARHPIIPGSSLRCQQSLHDRVIESSIVHAVVQPSGGTDEYDGWDLVSQCLEPNPRLRAGADEVAGHQYFADLDWKPLRSKKYPAPPPLKRAPPEEELDTSDFMESRSLREHETLHGVNIAGFNYENEDDNAIIRDHQTAETSIGDEDLSVSSDDDDLLGKLEAVPPESTYVTPAGSIVFDSSEVGLGSPSRGSSSTALYSCTSFGELREALKTNPSEKFPLPVSRPTSMPPFESGSDFQSNAANRILDRPHDPGQPSRPHSLAMYSYQESRPTSILVRQGSDVWTQETPTKTEFAGLGLGAKGLGLRKYASLDFDLDTVVSLDVNPRRVSTPGHKASKSEGNIALVEKPKPLRRVSFVDQDIFSAEEQPVQAVPTPLQASASSAGTASPWKSLSKIYSPNSGGNPTRLRKRRMESTPVFPTTPHLNAMAREKVDLPPGLEQIGLGIGYKYSGPPAGPSKENFKDRLKGSDTPGEPRRALSTGPTIGLSRCTALFSGIRKSRSTNAGKSTPSSSGERISEESDAFGAVMREMGRADWDAELGFAGPSMSPAQAQSSRRKAGRVYSVDPVAGAEAFSGSTLRLIQDVASPSDEFGR